MNGTEPGMFGTGFAINPQFQYMVREEDSEIKDVERKVDESAPETKTLKSPDPEKFEDNFTPTPLRGAPPSEFEEEAISSPKIDSRERTEYMSDREFRYNKEQSIEKEVEAEEDYRINKYCDDYSMGNKIDCYA